MKFHDFISSSLMAPDLKTRTDGRGDDSARAVVKRPSFVGSFTMQLSREGTLAVFFLFFFFLFFSKYLHLPLDFLR